MDAGAIAKPMSDLFAWHAIATDEVLRRLNARGGVESQGGANALGEIRTVAAASAASLIRERRRSSSKACPILTARGSVSSFSVTSETL